MARPRRLSLSGFTAKHRRFTRDRARRRPQSPGARARRFSLGPSTPVRYAGAIAICRCDMVYPNGCHAERNPISATPSIWNVSARPTPARDPMGAGACTRQARRSDHRPAALPRAGGDGSDPRSRRFSTAIARPRTGAGSPPPSDNLTVFPGNRRLRFESSRARGSRKTTA